jgi:hypothetical protein
MKLGGVSFPQSAAAGRVAMAIACTFLIRTRGVKILSCAAVLRDS